MFRDPSIFRPELFRDQAALITGGGTGIGLIIAAELRALGADVFICSRKAEHLQAGAEALASIEGDGRIETFSCDIRDADRVEATVAQVLDRFGRLDLLVNNAGGQFPSPAVSLSEKGWKAVIDTNLTGTFLMAQAAMNQAMSHQQSGSIVNIIAHIDNGFPMMAHTGAARAGVQNLTKTLAFEWAQSSVRVNAVAPGVVRSSGIEHYAPEFRKAFEGSIEHIPARRLGTPREIAAAVVFLLSPAAGFITGMTLEVDGGESLFGSTAAGQLRAFFTGSPTPTYE